jgi:hypothetical protein
MLQEYWQNSLSEFFFKGSQNLSFDCGNSVGTLQEIQGLHKEFTPFKPFQTLLCYRWKWIHLRFCVTGRHTIPHNVKVELYFFTIHPTDLHQVLDWNAVVKGVEFGALTVCGPSCSSLVFFINPAPMFLRMCIWPQTFQEVFNPLVMASLSKFRSKNVLNLSHNKLHSVHHDFWRTTSSLYPT